MAGLDRVIDPITKDYVETATGNFEYTSTAQTAIYHQLNTWLGEWIGDPDAGLDRSAIPRKNNQASLDRYRDAILQALRLLEVAGRVTNSQVSVTRNPSNINRADVDAVTTDIQNGNQIDVTPAAPSGA